MTEADPRTDLDQPRLPGRCGRVGVDPELLGCAPQQGGIADRLHCRREQQPSSLHGKRLQPA